MSHITKTKVPIPMTDRDCIIRAAKALGCKIIENGEARYWRGQKHKGEIVLQHQDSPFDVALNRDKNGAYQPEADLWGGHIQKIYGTPESPFGKLVSRYGAERAKKIARALGHTVYETVDQKTGTIIHKVVINNG